MVWNSKNLVGRVIVTGLVLLSLQGAIVSEVEKRLVPTQARIIDQVEPIYRAVLPHQEGLSFVLERATNLPATPPAGLALAKWERNSGRYPYSGCEIETTREQEASTHNADPLWRIDCYDADHILIADGLWDDRTGRLTAFDARCVRGDESSLPCLPDSALEQCARDWLIALHMATWDTLVQPNGVTYLLIRHYGEDCTVSLNLPNHRTVLWLNIHTGEIVKVLQMD